MLKQEGGSFLSVVLGIVDQEVGEAVHKCFMLLALKALILGEQVRI